MATIEQQLELEQRMIDAGAAGYIKNQRYAEKAGRGDQLDYAQRLMQEFVQPLAVALEAWLNKTGPGVASKSRTLMRTIDPNIAMFIALKNVFGSFTYEEIYPVAIASKIGSMIEDELRFREFRNDHEAYYKEVIEDFKRKGTQSYRHKHRVMTFKSNEKGQKWEPWTTKDKVDIGLKLLNIVLTETDLIERKDYMKGKRPVTALVPTKDTLEWINQHEEFKQFMFPIRMPCIVPPAEWTGMHDGGYYSPVLRQATPMVKAKHGKRSSKPVDWGYTMNALNRLQRVPWTINTRVLDILKEVWRKDLQIGVPSSQPVVIPPSPVEGLEKGQPIPDELQDAFTEWKRHATRLYTQDKERVSKAFQVTRVIRTANDYAEYERFFYVWYADFRGRLYSATSGLSPQGPDFAKGLLRLERGKPLGERGWYWLRVHLANRYGYDKASYDQRVAWVDAQRDRFIRCANDPLSDRELWANADKPYQFLAALFEYAGALQGASPSTYISHLPIGLDGSCNGLQNFSAMLRDAVGGKATNLLPGENPEDIYGIVAKVLVRKVEAVVRKIAAGKVEEGDDAHDFAQKWLAYGIDRKLCKRPVMTLPYGATRQSCTEYIWEELVDKNKELFGNQAFRAAVWLCPLLWSSIGEVVVAARQAMDWLQKCSSVISKNGDAIEWVTADGFRVYQKLVKIDTFQIESVLAGRFQGRVGTFSDKIDPVRQRLGVAPNFVHSQDATHMRMVINALEAEGIHDFAFIHDDYGTHACDTDTMHRVIREQFYKLYSENCPLTAFKNTVEAETGVVLPPLPDTGDLDLSLVLSSPYFFG
ncbi:RNA polymerase [Agrobacterium phage Atu_ph03]|uniref:DNA-directed RNA polymerase n=1 Tax=Agrobacterium phage Atu_ph03 TaxID=2024262 RepID=A0A223VZW7_9CAUD|nr:RNA polymerase [Agrobacterium phage Atu_ph03]ASV44581.1 DNA-directed RNA polymerase [Agrobacterium phage Atu_ph03]